MIAAIGRLASRRPGPMLAVLGVLVVGFAIVGGGVEDRLSVGGFLDPGAESSRVADTLEDEFATGSYGFVLLLTPTEEWVYSERNRPEGERITAAIDAEAGVVEVASFYNVTGPPPPGISPLRDGPGNHALIGVKLGGTEDEQRATAQRLHDTYVGPNEFFDIAATGSVEISRVAAEEAARDLQSAELLAAPFTLLGLLIVFRGVRAAVLPLLVAIFAVLGSFVALTIAVIFTDVSIFARTLVTALGLGLAIDYSLLMVARFREERGADRSVELAVSRTLQTAGRTVVFSAATVGSSLLGLLVFPVVYLRSFAIAGVAVVSTAALAALLVVPPLLVRFGERMGSTAPTVDSFWGRQAGRVMRRPVLWLAAATVVLIVVGLPFLRFEPARIDERVLPSDAEARVAAETIKEEMSWADVNPIQLVIPELDPDDPDAVFAMSKQLLALSGPVRVDSVLGYLRAESATPPNQLTAHFRPVEPEETDGTWLNVVSRFDPDDQRNDELITTLRALELDVDGDGSPDEVLVGGNGATVIDTVDTVTARVPAALAVIAVVTLALLFFMTGSVVVPVKALVLNLLSLTATFGALVWVFQDGNLSGVLGFTASGQLDVFTPILMFCVAFGLSMDYEVFLLARIKEEWDLTGDNDHAVRAGIGRTGPVVTAAAVLLAIVFVAIATSGVMIVKMFGLGLALAVVADAFLVRATITPALMKLAGRNNWWAPKSLRRFHLRWGVWETDPLIVPGTQR
ncbi:MAG: MMPL family transporter [Acidimicrobiales bacterium]